MSGGIIIFQQSVLLVEETGITGENHRSVVSHWQTYHIMLYRVHLAWVGFKLTTLVVIGTDCISSCKSNYHTIVQKMYMNIIYTYIASLLSLRHWLLTEAKPRLIVRVEGTRNLLFPNTQSISILLYRKTLDS